MQTLPKDNKNRSFIFEEEQIGWIPSILSIAVILLISLAYFNEWGNNPLPLAGYIISTAIVALILLLFYKLKVKVSSREIHIAFGVGIIRIKIEFDEISEVNVARTSWYQGLGIRLTPEGMLYNIHGSISVKITCSRNGIKKIVQIGSADPNSLKEFLLALK